MADGDLTIKELLLQIVLPKLDGIERKLDQKADLADLVALETRVNTAVQKAQTDLTAANLRMNNRDTEIDGALASLVAWRNRTVGALALLTFLGSTVGVLGTLFGHLFP